MYVHCTDMGRYLVPHTNGVWLSSSPRPRRTCSRSPDPLTLVPCKETGLLTLTSGVRSIASTRFTENAATNAGFAPPLRSPSGFTFQLPELGFCALALWYFGTAPTTNVTSNGPSAESDRAKRCLSVRSTLTPVLFIPLTDPRTDARPDLLRPVACLRPRGLNGICLGRRAEELTPAGGEKKKKTYSQDLLLFQEVNGTSLRGLGTTRYRGARR